MFVWAATCVSHASRVMQEHLEVVIVRHAPFLQALAAAQATQDAAWREAAAGYLVLRFFDQWLEEGPAALTADPSLAAIRARVRSMVEVEPHARRLLLNALNTLFKAKDAAVAPVSGPLLAYGTYLESIGRLKLAAHVYKVVATALDADHGHFDLMSLATTLIQHASAARRSGQLDDADVSYERAMQIGSALGDRVIILRALTGMADVTKAHGNALAAEVQLDMVLDEADRALAEPTITPAIHDALTHARCLALQSRGAARHICGRYIEAIADYFAAFNIAYDHVQHEAVLNDLALCAAEAGFRATARQAHAYLAKTARTPVARSAALVNLLELVVLDGDEAAYDVVRAQISEFLRTHTMSAEHAAYAALYSAHGLERFSSSVAAIRAYRDVVVHARTAGLSQVENKAKQRLAALSETMSTSRVTTSLPSADIPDVLRDVAAAIENMHMLDSKAAQVE